MKKALLVCSIRKWLDSCKTMNINPIDDFEDILGLPMLPVIEIDQKCNRCGCSDETHWGVCPNDPENKEDTPIGLYVPIVYENHFLKNYSGTAKLGEVSTLEKNHDVVGGGFFG